MRIQKPKRGDANKRTIELLLNTMGEIWWKEHRFHPKRLWRFDYAIPALKIAVEYNGNGQTGGGKHIGGHGSIVGMTGDCEKLNEAQLLGWHVIQFTAFHFRDTDRAKHKLTPPLARIQMAINERSKPQ